MVTVSNSYGVGSFSSDEIVERCVWVNILWHIHLQVSQCKMYEQWTQGMWKVTTCVICQLKCTISLFFLFKIIIICFWWRHLKISRCYAWSFKPSVSSTLIELSFHLASLYSPYELFLILYCCSSYVLICTYFVALLNKYLIAETW